MSEFVWKTMKKKTKKKINKRTWKESSIFRESECLLLFLFLPDFVGFRAFVLFRFGSVCFCIVVNLGRGLSFLLVFLLWILQLVFLGVFSFQ